MTVTQLKLDGKYKVQVDLDGEYAFFLYQKELRRLCFKEGDELSDQLVEDIYQLILLPRAKDKALSLLKYGNRTTKELSQRLEQAGYPAMIIRQVLGFLKEYRFLDDKAYVQSYIELHGQKKSRMQMQQELGRKGIPKEMFEQAWAERPEEMEEEALKALMQKRMRTKGPVTKENFQKHYAFFARKGYPSSMIIGLLSEYRERECEDFI